MVSSSAARRSSSSATTSMTTVAVSSSSGNEGAGVFPTFLAKTFVQINNNPVDDDLTMLSDIMII